MSETIVYTCVSNGYDAVAAVPLGWRARFIMFHDGSVDVPQGWEGRVLSVDGLKGVGFNRYAKMLPHRLQLPGDKSMYVDGNMFFKRDPAERIQQVTSNHAFAAMAHPEMAYVFADIRRALEIGFVWPLPAMRITRELRRLGLPADMGLFEAGILYRRHDDPSTIRLCEEWWRLWQIGYPRDQPLLVAASHITGVPITSLGKNDVRDPANTLMGMSGHARLRPRHQRIWPRLASEFTLFRLWTRNRVGGSRISD